VTLLLLSAGPLSPCACDLFAVLVPHLPPLAVDIDVALQEKRRIAMSAGVAVVGNSASVVRFAHAPPYER